MRDHERLVLDKVDETARIGLVNDAMIDAAKRIEGTLGRVGRANAKWLRALIAPKQPPVYVTGHQAEVI